MRTVIDRASQKLILPDGRTLGFAEYGAASGPTIMWFHGYPGARVMAVFLETEALKRDIRIVAPDRPGFGLSTPQPGRTILDHAADVKHLAGHLQLSSFAVLGNSGGGPYALACAYAFPAHIVTAVGLQASIGPWMKGAAEPMPPQAAPSTMPLTFRANVWATKYCPVSYRHCIDTVMSMTKLLSTTRLFIWRLDAHLGKHQLAGNSMSIDTQRQYVLDALLEPFAQGAGAMITEGRLLSRYWGFRLEDIVYSPVLLWHGTADKNVPIASAKYMAGALSHAKLKEYHADHHTLDEHASEILDDMLQQMSQH